MVQKILYLLFLLTFIWESYPSKGMCTIKKSNKNWSEAGNKNKIRIGMETRAWSEHKKDRTETTWTPNQDLDGNWNGQPFSREKIEKKTRVLVWVLIWYLFWFGLKSWFELYLIHCGIELVVYSPPSWFLLRCGMVYRLQYTFFFYMD